MHILALQGCRPRPLSSYLKALAVLRLVAEQKDPSARGFWKDDCFHLVTALNERELEHFFLHEWRPTAIVSPWNKGSGFFNGSNDKGLGPVVRSVAPRFVPLRHGVGEAAALVEEMKEAVLEEKRIKGESNVLKTEDARATLRADPTYKQRLASAARACKKLKDELQPECQRRWRGGALGWLRAAMVLQPGEKPSFPGLLGTGGNDGKLDFTNNSLQRLGDLFDLGSPLGDPREGSAALLRAAFWGEPSLGRVKGGIGQFSPGDSGGANATAGPLSDSQLNPWDLPLLLEGSLLFSAASTRRLAGRASAQAAAPFAVRGQSAGYGSASRYEDEATSRGEQWMPLWSQPCTLDELKSLLAEGRCQVGARTSESAMDVARSIARLGVARGLSSFERYGYLTRNGKSNYAVPLGTWEVKSEPRGLLLDDLEHGDWWGRVRRAARDAHAPASFVRLEQLLGSRVMEALAGGGHPGKWQGVLSALAQLEHQMVLSGSFTVKARLGPIPPLSSGWVEASDDGRAESRLALVLANAGRLEHGRWVDPVRCHWLPLDPRQGGRFHVREKSLAADPRVVCGGRAAQEDLIKLVQRRLVEGKRTVPLLGRDVTASPGDLAALVDGAVDVTRTFWLARALSALVPAPPGRARQRGGPAGELDLDPVQLAFRLAHAPFEVELQGRLVRIPVDPSAFRLLAAGEATRAFEIVSRRLRAAGLDVPYRAASLEPLQAARLAASLAFPISPQTAALFARQLVHPTQKEHQHVR